MIKHHINHTFWCLNPNSGDTGGLLDTQFSNWDEAKYGLFEESLADSQLRQVHRSRPPDCPGRKRSFTH